MGRDLQLTFLLLHTSLGASKQLPFSRLQLCFCFLLE